MNHSSFRGLAFAAPLLVALFAAGCGGSVTAPTAYQNYNAKDQSFSIDYPEGWEATGGGQSGFYGARFSSGSASIKVTADMVGSAIGDIAKSFSTVAGDTEDEEHKPIAQVHALGKTQMADEFGNYLESPAVPVRTAFGEARLAEFTGRTTFGDKMHGYRLTALSVDRRITVVCYCRDPDWTKLKPAFEKVYTSVKQGR
jgi:hypothetical protein